MHTIKISNQLLSLDKPLVMGILNLTKDSFYDGGKYLNQDKAQAHIDKMIKDGADIIDLGAFSSRPGAEMVSNAEQIKLLEPMVSFLSSQFPNFPISLDICHSEIVNELAAITSFLVNDISGFSWDDQLIQSVSNHKLPYVLMHIKGRPTDMQSKADYKDVTFEILDYMAQKLHMLNSAGVNEVIIDPGFGFAKTTEQNFELLSKLNVFNIFEYPVMVGLSRKSMIYKTLGIMPQDALNGSTALHMTSLMNGAKILRVHDVKEAKETCTLWEQLQSPELKNI